MYCERWLDREQGTSEIKDLERQCEETLSKARSEAAALLDSAKKESTKAQNEAMDKAKTVRPPVMAHGRLDAHVHCRQQGPGLGR